MRSYVDRPGGPANTVNVLRLVVCALLALPVGWFAGVLIDRVPERESLTPLPGVRLSGKYLFVQLAMLVLFVLAALRFDDEPVGMLVGYLFLFAMLLTVSVIDIQLLPVARPASCCRRSSSRWYSSSPCR